MITTGLTSAHLRRQLAERDATITRLTAERDALRGAVETACNAFAGYARLHAAKLTGVLSEAEQSAIRAKIRRNTDLADEMRATLKDSDNG
jgi:hypothetical protein